MMSSLVQLLSDVDNSVGRGSGQVRARTLRRITDLFAVGADAFSADQVALFDAVIQRFASAIETGARVELAERLARLENAPPGILAHLAHDEIVVARPVLTGAARLDDQTLLDVALRCGRDHMLAICERPVVSSVVTDVLVAQGDGVVRHAIASNGGACFSLSGTAALVDHAARDEALGSLLTGRGDLPAEARRRLIALAKASARERLRAAFPEAGEEIAGAVERGASRLGEPTTAEPRDYRAAVAALEADAAGPPLTEADLVRIATAGQVEKTVAALAGMTGLSLPCLDRIFEEKDNDLLLVIGKARGWAWATVRVLLRLRDPSLSERHHVRRAEETFDGLAAATAGRVVHFLKVRETAGHLGPAGRSERLRF